MSSKCNHLVAAIFAAAIVFTAFGSDFYCLKSRAANDEITEEEVVEVVEEAVETTEIPEEVPFVTDVQEEVPLVTEVWDEEETAEIIEIEPVACEVPAESEAASIFEYPSQLFTGSTSGMNVSVEAFDGVFPAGTTMSLSAVSDSEALSAAEDALDGQVKEAKGVDISFANAQGEEIEPKGAVMVSITLADALEGEAFGVVHLDDNGNSEMVAGASESGANFTADAFSIYIVAGFGNSDNDDEDNKAIATYNYYYNGNIFYSQQVKKGDELNNPGNPVAGVDKTIFLGWFEAKEDGSFIGNPFSAKAFDFGTVENVEAGATYDVYAGAASYDLSFGENGAFSLNVTVITGNEVRTVSLSGSGINTPDYYSTLIVDGGVVTVDPGYCEFIRKEIDLICKGEPITCDLIKYLIDVQKEKRVDPEYTYITYFINYGDNKSSTIESLVINEKVTAADIATLGWTREGYEFLGWSKVPGENKDALFVSAGDSIAADNSGDGNYLYAIWKKIDDPVVDPGTPATEDPSTPSDPEPTPSADPAPSTDPAPAEDPTPTVETVPAPAAPSMDAPAADAPQVLGATRSEELPEVLGARRAATADPTNVVARVISLLLAATIALGLIVLGKKKEE